MTYRTRNILIAVALAVLAALLTSVYVSNYKRNVRNAESSVTVWVAKSDIPVGTAGPDIVKGHLLVKEDVARRMVVPGAIASPDDVDRQVLVQPVYAGEQITARRFGDVGEQGVRGQLKGTLRAVQLPGEPAQLLVGTLKAGDRVDLLADIPYGNDLHASRIVLRDLLVLQAPEETVAGKLGSGSNGDASVVLAVRDTQSTKLQWVVAPDRNNDWTLQLRPPIDAADSREQAESQVTVLREGLTAKQWDRFTNGPRSTP